MLIVDTSQVACCDSYPRQFECSLCGFDVEEECSCLLDDNVDELILHCHSCGTVNTVPVEDIVTVIDDSYDVPVGDSDEMFFENQKTIVRYTTCRHYDRPVEFPDGTVVHASSAHTRPAGTEAPDFGLYLDPVWNPSCVSYSINWPDRDIPEKLAVAAYTIIDVFNKARQGVWVEVGCIGGHGRTGTVLACMAVLAGIEATKAVEWVRDVYCKEAIETIEQEWMVEWFDAFVNGGTSPHEPIYNYNTKKYVDGHTYTYDAALVWEEYSPLDLPRGGPSKVDENRWTVVKWHEVEVDDDDYEEYDDEEFDKYAEYVEAEAF